MVLKMASEEVAAVLRENISSQNIVENAFWTSRSFSNLDTLANFTQHPMLEKLKSELECRHQPCLKPTTLVFPLTVITILNNNFENALLSLKH